MDIVVVMVENKNNRNSSLRIYFHDERKASIYKILTETLSHFVWKDITNDIEIRLVGGKVSSEGRVEILYNGQWGTICDDSTDQVDIDIMCRMMGYS